MIQFRGNIYIHEYDLMYFSGNKWLDRKTMTMGFIHSNMAIINGTFENSELILNI